MSRTRQAGFTLSTREVRNNILIPRYYDPRIERDLEDLRDEFVLVSLSDLIAQGHLSHTHGDYVPKMFYGTGPFPYVRTSDLANWEIKASPKHGVPESVYRDYAEDQRVCGRDILFVHEGTYLIGAVAMVTEFDGPLLYQHHLAKFTINDGAPFDAYYLLVAFESPIVRRQVRSKQFSADIIDSVVGRLDEVVIPYPKDAKRLKLVQSRAARAVVGRARLREKVAYAAEKLDDWLAGSRSITCEDIFGWEPSPEESRESSFLGGRQGFAASTLKSNEIKNDILLPRYYDPLVAKRRREYLGRCDVRSIGELVKDGKLRLDTGDEIGRLNYGTGKIPFVRTSDFGSWELKREAKQGISDEVHQVWAERQDVKAGDIFLVRDGTYLVGTSVLVCDDDLPLVYCGGIFKLRSLDEIALPPGLLFALLNLPYVKRQIRNKQFTRDVIDTLGQRIQELLLPIPKDAAVRTAIGDFFASSIATRAALRSELNVLSTGLTGDLK